MRGFVSILFSLSLSLPVALNAAEESSENTGKKTPTIVETPEAGSPKVVVNQQPGSPSSQVQQQEEGGERKEGEEIENPAELAKKEESGVLPQESSLFFQICPCDCELAKVLLQTGVQYLTKDLVARLWELQWQWQWPIVTWNVNKGVDKKED